MEFFVEGQASGVVLDARDSMFMPRGFAQGVYYRSPEIEVLLVVQAEGEQPVALDTYFDQVSEPATGMELSSGATTYIMDDPERATLVGAAHGVVLLSPEDTARRLPHYLRFGANLPAQPDARA